MQKIWLLLIMSFNILFAQNNFKKQYNIRWVKNDFIQKSDKNLNNFPPVKLSSKIKESFLKANFGRTNTVYLVYRTASTKGEQLLNLYGNEVSHNFNSHFLVKNDSLDLKKGIKDKGMFISHSFNQKKKKEAFIVLNNQYVDSTTAVYEMIFIDDKLSIKEKNGLETYLALKYGISLHDINDYKNHHGVNIWNGKLNKAYNFNLFGIGKNRYYNFLNNKSSHSEDASVIVQFDTLNILDRSDFKGRTNLHDDEYLILGSNNKKIHFIDDEKSKFKSLERKWMVQKIGNHSKQAFLRFNCNELGIDTINAEKKYVLLLNRKEDIFESEKNTNVIEGTIKEGELIFSKINWDEDLSGADYFTIGLRKELNVEISIKASEKCFSPNHVELNIKKGNASYKIEITDIKTGKEEIIETEKDKITFEFVPDNSIKIRVTDANGLQFEKIIEDENKISKSEVVINLHDKFSITESKRSVILSPKIINVDKEELEFKWYKLGKIVGSNQNLETSEEGTYILVVKNQQGCSSKYTTTVLKEKASNYLMEDWTIYPNPAKSNEYFSIHFNFSEPTYVKYYIYTLEGKLISEKEVGFVTENVIKERIPFSGTYQILATYKNLSQIKKVIIY